MTEQDKDWLLRVLALIRRLHQSGAISEAEASELEVEAIEATSR